MSSERYHWNEPSPLRICLTASPAPMVAHWQNELEMMYFFETSGCRYQCGGQELFLGPEELVTVNPGVTHACGCWGEGVRALCLIVDPTALNLPRLPGWQFTSALRGDASAAASFRRLAQLLSEPDTPARDCRIHECICGLLAHLLDFAVPAPPEPEPERKAEIRRVMAYITDHRSERLSLAGLAAGMYLSEDRFYHVFREVTGMSPGEYILAERIRAACTLLGNTPMKIVDIAQECGFCTSGYFAKMFRRQMGCTPLQYRKALRSAGRNPMDDLSPQ